MPNIEDYVPGQGNFNTTIVLLGEAPSFEEVRQKKPFVGPSGGELNRLLKDAGINREECWVTNVCKYMVPPNIGKKKIPFHVRAKQAGIDIDQQLRELQIEINQIKPNIIIGLGGTALWALTGKTKITNYRGSIMWGLGHKCISTYHPAHLLHSAKGGEFKGYWNRQVMIADLKRAKKQAQFAELRLPQRHIEICRDSSHLIEFYNRYRHLRPVWVDIEAGGHCLPICIGIAFNPHHALVIPLWNKDGISSIPTSDLASIWMLLAQILWNHEVHGQNFNYDRDKIARLGFAIQSIKGDTMLKAFAINPELPKGLAFNTSIFTEEPFYKDEGMYEGELKDLFIGCGKDACVTCEIDLMMDSDLDELNQREFYENFLLKLPDFYLEIEQNGFGIDESKREELLRKYVEWDERIAHELYQLTGIEVNVNSPKQVAVLLFQILKLPERAGTGEEELTSLLNLQSFTDVNNRRIVELILEGRRVRKTISTYLLAIPDYDGRMKTTCFPCLETGRSSNGQQEPPIRPYVEIRDEDGKKKKRAMGTAFQTLTKHDQFGDIRGMYLPI
jgi:uracil-DNA glycosylase family 4